MGWCQTCRSKARASFRFLADYLRVHSASCRSAINATTTGGRLLLVALDIPHSPSRFHVLHSWQRLLVNAVDDFVLR